MSFNAIRENKILAKITESTILRFRDKQSEDTACISEPLHCRVMFAFVPNFMT